MAFFIQDILTGHLRLRAKDQIAGQEETASSSSGAACHNEPQEK
jgi:hypothetical protein